MKLDRMLKVAFLGAIAGMLMIFIQISIPIASASMLKYDPSDIPALIAGFALGPIEGLLVVIIKAFLFLMAKGTPDAFIGVPMNIIAVGTFVLVSSMIYRTRKTKKMALISLGAGVMAMTVVMVPANYLVYPLFAKMFLPGIVIDKGALLGFLLATIVPFNLIKGILNSILVFLVYKRVGILLKIEESWESKRRKEKHHTYAS